MPTTLQEPLPTVAIPSNHEALDRESGATSIVPVLTQGDLPHKSAADFIGRDPKVLNDLRKTGIIHPDWKNPERKISESTGGKSAWHYAVSSLEILKPCMKTGNELWANGIVKPDDGHLWILEDTEAGAAIVDLGKSSGPIYSIAAAAEKVRVDVKTLRNRIKSGRGPGTRTIYGGGGWQQVITLVALDAWKIDHYTPTKIDSEKWKTHGQICDAMGITTEGERRELTECLEAWVAELGLDKKYALVIIEGKTRAKSNTPEEATSLNDNASPSASEKVSPALKTTKKPYEMPVYDLGEVQKLWQRFPPSTKEDPEKYVDEARKLIGKGGCLTATVREHFLKKGIVKARLRRVLRRAGVVPVGYQKKRYVVTHRGETPRRKTKQRGEAAAWVKSRLANGPYLVNSLWDEAEKAGYSGSPFWKALKSIGRTEYYRAFGSTRWAFWRLPEDQPLSKEEAHRIIAEYRAKKLAAGERTTVNGRGMAATSPIQAVPPIAAADAKRPRGRGRPEGRDPEVVRREEDMCKDWEAGKFKTKAEAGRAYEFQRSRASVVIDEYMKRREAEEAYK